jgi:hypothetical protein
MPTFSEEDQGNSGISTPTRSVDASFQDSNTAAPKMRSLIVNINKNISHPFDCCLHNVTCVTTKEKRHLLFLRQQKSFKIKCKHVSSKWKCPL